MSPDNTSKTAETPSAEWIYNITADDAGNDIDRLHLCPDEDDKRRIADRLGLVALKNLTADLRLTREQGNLVVHITGQLQADIEQRCVVTLDPIETHVEDEFEAWYADPDQAIPLNKIMRQKELAEEYGSEAPILEEQDDPEPIIDGKINVAELVVQYLSLSINPYPHAEHADFENKEKEAHESANDRPENPFAALKDWKTKLQDKD